MRRAPALGGSLSPNYIKCRDAGRVQSTALVTAIGAGSGGYRRLLGLDAVDTESYDGWKSFLLSLRAGRRRSMG